MRSVCGCISASSAATEIMNTPRSVATFARMLVRRVAITTLRRPARSSDSRGLPLSTFESSSTTTRCSGESARGTSITKR